MVITAISEDTNIVVLIFSAANLFKKNRQLSVLFVATFRYVFLGNQAGILGISMPTGSRLFIPFTQRVKRIVCDRF